MTWTTRPAAPASASRCERRIVERLAEALESGAWDRAHGALRDQESFDGSLRLVISEPEH